MGTEIVDIIDNINGCLFFVFLSFHPTLLNYQSVFTHLKNILDSNPFKSSLGNLGVIFDEGCPQYRILKINQELLISTA